MSLLQQLHHHGRVVVEARDHLGEEGEGERGGEGGGGERERGRRGRGGRRDRERREGEGGGYQQELTILLCNFAVCCLSGQVAAVC